MVRDQGVGGSNPLSPTNSNELTVGAIGRNSGRAKPNPTLCAVIVRNIPSIFTPVRA